MPLDAGTFQIDSIVPIDPLTKLGITPIPNDAVENYKADYRAAYIHKYHPSKNLMLIMEWRTISFDGWKVRGDKVANFGFRMAKRNHALLAYFLAAPMRYEIWGADLSSPPRKLVALAKTVVDRIPDAEVSVDYFYDDPILHVHYSTQGVRHKACLGIWDKRRIVAIADHKMPRRGILSWFR